MPEDMDRDLRVAAQDMDEPAEYIVQHNNAEHQCDKKDGGCQPRPAVLDGRDNISQRHGHKLHTPCKIKRCSQTAVPQPNRELKNIVEAQD
ncbi:hypothetical protein DWX75_05940 [Mitsuokella sp. AF21-1AC]|nr:hypothetical protein DWX75_05940 [Mitsuokella sp. AF21-1AC]